MVSEDKHRKVPLASILGKRLDLAFDGAFSPAVAARYCFEKLKPKRAFYPASLRRLQTVGIRVIWLIVWQSW